MDSESPQNNDVGGKSSEPTVETDGNVYKSYQAANAAPPGKLSDDEKKDITEIHNEKIVQPLRTYESDVADLLRKKETSVIKIATAQKKKEERQQKEAIVVHKAQIIPKQFTYEQPPAEPKPEPKFKPEPAPEPIVEPLPEPKIEPRVEPRPEPKFEQRREPKRRREPIHFGPLVVPLSIFLVIVGISVLGYFGYRAYTSMQPVAIHQSPQPVLSSNSEQKIILPDGETIARALAVQKPTIPGASGTLVQIVFVKGTTTQGEVIDAETFARRLPSTMQSWLSASFYKEFAFGYHILGTPEPFIIFKTSSYENGFAGMLKWESTLKDDIAKLRLSPSTAVISTSTPLVFQDVIISNKDVRVLRDSRGIPIVMYSLPDQQTIVIATNETTLKEIFSRLATSKFVQ
jgi:hypothetical protein